MFEATTRLREKMPSNFLDMSAPALPISRRRRRLAARFVALLSAGALVSTNLPAKAQKGPPIIRDAEIEQLLKEYTQPILRVAGLSQQNIQVVIINDRSFNAFVAGRATRPANLRNDSRCRGARPRQPHREFRA